MRLTFSPNPCHWGTAPSAARPAGAHDVARRRIHAIPERPRPATRPPPTLLLLQGVACLREEWLPQTGLPAMCALSLGPVRAPAGKADGDVFDVFVRLTIVFRAFTSVVADIPAAATPDMMRLVPYVAADAAVLYVRRQDSREALEAVLEIAAMFPSSSSARLETGEPSTERRRPPIEPPTEAGPVCVHLQRCTSCTT